VHRLDVLNFEPPLLEVEVECGKGTYIRSPAHDIGAELGVGGSLDALVRTRVGGFRIEDAAGIESLRTEFESDAWRKRLLPPDEVLVHWPAAILGPENERLLRTGQVARFAEEAAVARARAYSIAGEFVAVIEPEGPGAWRPAKVFNLSI
jgi:tRNA pseudouridine55 synthase